MRIVGISAFYHDAAAALVADGEIVAAAQEERFTRKKHDSRFPRHALEYCLAEAGIGLDQVDLVAFYDKPLLKFERLLETYLAFAPRGFESFRMAIPVWLREKLFLKDLLQNQLKQHRPDFDWDQRLIFSEHHLSHAASAFFPSPYASAAVLTLDGVGEWATSSLSLGRDNRLEVIKEIHFPHSLGLLYSAFTYYTGFKVNSGEYKLMGLAPYGEPRYAGLILDKLIDLKDRRFVQAQPRLLQLLRRPDHDQRQVRRPVRPAAAHSGAAADPVPHGHRRLGAAGDRGDRAAHDARHCAARPASASCAWRAASRSTASRTARSCATAVSTASGSSRRRATPAARSARRCAPTTCSRINRAGRTADSTACAAPTSARASSRRELEQRLRASGARFSVVDDAGVIAQAADALVAQKALGWFQGRMEFGPRALGARSILGDPRSPSMQKMLNLKVKYRESFRPFAPAVLREDVSDWFELDYDSPYMLLVAGVKPERRRAMTEEERKLFGIDKLNVPRSDIPAVTHVDYSARVQTVHRETNPRFHALLEAFKQRTGCPVLVNTSFNVRGEPIVCTPEDAFRCFMGSDIETLVIGNCVLHKEQQNPALRLDYKHAFELD